VNKRKSTPKPFAFTSRITDDHGPLKFPKGALLKGDLILFQADRAALRRGMVVITRTTSGDKANFYRPAIHQQVVAIVRKVVLPARSIGPDYRRSAERGQP
jgi:hypothetical protein